MITSFRLQLDEWISRGAERELRNTLVTVIETFIDLGAVRDDAISDPGSNFDERSNMKPEVRELVGRLAARDVGDSLVRVLKQMGASAARDEISSDPSS
jgi:hypothetical protein